MSQESSQVFLFIRFLSNYKSCPYINFTCLSLDKSRDNIFLFCRCYLKAFTALGDHVQYAFEAVEGDTINTITPSEHDAGMAMNDRSFIFFSFRLIPALGLERSCTLILRKYFRILESSPNNIRDKKLN